MSGRSRRLMFSALFFVASLSALFFAPSAALSAEACDGRGLLCEKVTTCETAPGTKTCTTSYSYYW